MRTMLKNMTKMANSHAGYIALLQQFAFLCKGWVGDRSINYRRENIWQLRKSEVKTVKIQRHIFNEDFQQNGV